MKDQKLIDELMILGLTAYEAKVYCAVVRFANSPAAELATVAGIPRPKVYQVLAQLSEKGLISETLGKKKQFQAVEPKVAFNHLEQGLQASYEEKKKLLNDLPEEFQALLEENNGNNHPLQFIQVIKQDDAITSKVQSLISEAQKEILFFTKAPYLKPLQNNEEGKNPLSRGVKVRSIYVASEVKEPSMYTALKSFSAAGEEIRIVEQLPMKLAVIDSRIVMLMLVDSYSNKTSFTTMVIEHPDLAKTFKIIFEFFWKEGVHINNFKNRIEEKK